MFRYKLYEERKKQRLTLEELANKYNSAFPGSGMTKSSLSKYENGKQDPWFSTARNLAQVLGVPISYLMGEDETKEPETTRQTSEEAYAVLEAYESRPELRLLCSLSIKATPEDVRKAIQIFEMLQSNSK